MEQPFYVLEREVGPMPTTPTKPFRMAPLQRLSVRPIEDPVEQAALEERSQRGRGNATDFPSAKSEGAEMNKHQEPFQID
jgi:hypothetical protein